MGGLRQILAVTLMSLLALPRRIGSALVTVIGVACVVGVMISLLAVSAGLMESARKHQSASEAIVLSSGQAAEYMGSISASEVSIIADAPGVKLDPAGKPEVEPEATVVVEVSKRSDGADANIGLQGVGPEGAIMNRTLKLIAGRMFRPAVHELIVGREASAQFRNLGLGDHISLRGVDWQVVGVFSDEGALSENAMIADANTVLQAFDRNAYQMVVVELTSPNAFGRFKDALATNPQLSLDVKRQADYARDQLKQITSIFNFIGYFIGAVMALGAIFGAINTMYSAVDARAREIATLRAIGFGGAAMGVSVITESLLIAVPGALLGALAAFLLFNHHNLTLLGPSFPLAVTPGLVVLGVIWALAIGLIGGLAPAVRAAQLPVADALRAT
jgi:putative ABC transport system permease protein